MKCKKIESFDITELERCPHCSSSDIIFNGETIGFWFCNYCGEIWEELK